MLANYLLTFSNVINKISYRFSVAKKRVIDWFLIKNTDEIPKVPEVPNSSCRITWWIMRKDVTIGVVVS